MIFFLYFACLYSIRIYFRLISGNSAVDYVTDHEASGSGDVICNENLQPPSKKKKTAEQWKEKYFASIVDTGEKSCEADIIKSNLKSYHTLLKCMQLEKQMGLKDYEIDYLRATISDTLSKHPNYLSSYEVEDIE